MKEIAKFETEDSIKSIFSKDSWLKWDIKLSKIDTSHHYSNTTEMTLVGFNFKATDAYSESLLSYLKKLRFNPLYIDTAQLENNEEIGEFTIALNFIYQNKEIDWWKSSATLFIREKVLDTIFSNINSGKVNQLALFAKINQDEMIKKLDFVVHNPVESENEYAGFNLPVIDWMIDCN